MRISRQAKQERRCEILGAARQLFQSRGFEATTTRDLARTADIAVGTLFNYFESKEALAAELIDVALEEARGDFRARWRADESLEEALFLHVICGLRRLEPYRGFVGAVLESALFAGGPGSGAAETGARLRAGQIEVVEEIAAACLKSCVNADPARVVPRPGFVSLHLYWTLYLGVLAFWTGDESPHQEETLAVLDESLHLFAESLLRPSVARS